MARRSRRLAAKADRRSAPRSFDPSQLRGVLGEAFLSALVSDFKAKGRRIIPRLRRERRQDYLKLILGLLPRPSQGKDVDAARSLLDRLAIEDEAAYLRILDYAWQELEQPRTQEQGRAGSGGTVGGTET